MLIQVNLIPKDAQVYLHGSPVTIQRFAGVVGCETGYATSPQDILNSISNAKMLWNACIHKEGVKLYEAASNLLLEVCECKNIVEIVFAGDMIILSHDVAIVNALDAFDLLANVCGIPTSYQTMTGCRVHITDCPIPALELQRQLDCGDWDTSSIISTDQKVINLYKAYANAREVIKKSCQPTEE